MNHPSPANKLRQTNTRQAAKSVSVAEVVLAAAGLLVVLTIDVVYAPPEPWLQLPRVALLLWAARSGRYWVGLALIALLMAPALYREAAGLAERGLAELFTQAIVLAVVAGLAVRLRKSETSRREAESVDPLTGLANRTALAEKLEGELSRSQRFGTPLSVALLDIDNFKRFNDQQGHVAGDRLLRKIGSTILQVIRRYDLAARLGGDEFVIVFPAADADGARSAIERVRHALANIDPPATFSIGVVTMLSCDDLSATDALDAADQAMYRVKQGPKNNVNFEVIP